MLYVFKRRPHSLLHNVCSSDSLPASQRTQPRDHVPATAACAACCCALEYPRGYRGRSRETLGRCSDVIPATCMCVRESAMTIMMDHACTQHSACAHVRPHGHAPAVALELMPCHGSQPEMTDAGQSGLPTVSPSCGEHTHTHTTHNV